MIRMRGKRIELKLTPEQRNLCAKSAGTSRYAYNWKLGKLIGEYEACKALGQCIPLISSGIELYTKKSIVGSIPEFEPYLYRKSDTFPDIDLYKHQFLDIVESKMDLDKIIE